MERPASHPHGAEGAGPAGAGLQGFLRTALDALGGEFVLLAAAGPEGPRPLSYACRLDRAELETLGLPPGEGPPPDWLPGPEITRLCDYAGTSGPARAWVRKEREEDAMDTLRKGTHPFRRLLCLPVDSGDRRLGILLLGHRAPRPLSGAAPGSPAPAWLEALAAGAAGWLRWSAEREQREEAERARAGLEAGLAAMAEAVPDCALFAVDPAGRVSAWSAGAERLFGYAEAEIAGRDFAALFPPGEAPPRPDEAAARDRNPSEVTLVRKDGRAIPARLARWGNPQATSPATGFAVAACDPDGPRQDEEQARQARKMEAMGRLAGGVAHDFNNLLMAINGYSALALDGLSPTDPSYRSLEEIRRAGEQAARLTRQLLAFSRKAPAEGSAPGPADPNRVIQDLARMLRRLIGAHIRMALRLDPGAGPARIEAGQFEQIVMNLTLNARDAMPGGGDLAVETARVRLEGGEAGLVFPAVPGEYVRLTVADTGEGMDADTARQVFEPFFTTKGQGTGLGLSTVYGIVKRAQGNLAVDSRPGAGARFSVYLPRGEGEAGAREAPEAPPARGGETILVVEDEAAVRDLLRIVLEVQGYRVLAAADGERALGLAGSARPDLVLTDVLLPGMNGRDLARRLRAANPGLPILFMSGYAQEHERTQEAGGDGFLPKPFTAAEILRQVRESLDTARTGARSGSGTPGGG